MEKKKTNKINACISVSDMFLTYVIPCFSVWRHVGISIMFTGANPTFEVLPNKSERSIVLI